MTAFGYYLWPAVWLGARRDRTTDIDPNELRLEVARRKLSCGIIARGSRDGFIAFDFTAFADLDPTSEPGFDPHVLRALRRVELLSAHLCCLYAAAMETQGFCLAKQYLTPDSVIRSSSLDVDDFSGSGTTQPFDLLMARYPSTYNSQFPYVLDWRNKNRLTTISEATLDRSFSLFDEAVALADDQLLTQLHRHLLAAALFEQHDYGLSLSGSWTNSEIILGRLWNKLNNDRGLSGPRAKRLADNRTFSAAVRTEILQLSGLLTVELYESCCAVRKARNDWMHELRPVSRSTATDAIALTEHLIALHHDFTIRVPVSSYISS